MTPTPGPEGFTEFVATQRAPLLRFAMVLTGDYREAEDLVADVLGHAYERWDRIARADSPPAYVRTMITNRYVSSRRRHGLWLRRRSQLAERDELADPTDDVDRREAMIARLALLPPRQRSVIVMRYYLNLPDTEIAEHLGCRPATVRSHAARALTALRVDLSATSAGAPAGVPTDRTGRR